VFYFKCAGTILVVPLSTNPAAVRLSKADLPVCLSGIGRYADDADQCTRSPPPPAFCRLNFSPRLLIRAWQHHQWWPPKLVSLAVSGQIYPPGKTHRAPGRVSTLGSLYPHYLLQLCTAFFTNER